MSLGARSFLPCAVLRDQVADRVGASAARVAEATDLLRSAYHREGFVFVRLQPHEAGAGGAGVNTAAIPRAF